MHAVAPSRGYPHATSCNNNNNNNNMQYIYGSQKWSCLVDKSSDLVCSDISG